MEIITVKIVDIKERDVVVEHPDGARTTLKNALINSMYLGQEIQIRKKAIRMKPQETGRWF